MLSTAAGMFVGPFAPAGSVLAEPLRSATASPWRDCILRCLACSGQMEQNGILPSRSVIGNVSVLDRFQTGFTPFSQCLARAARLVDSVVPLWSLCRSPDVLLRGAWRAFHWLTTSRAATQPTQICIVNFHNVAKLYGQYTCGCIALHCLACNFIFVCQYFSAR